MKKDDAAWIFSEPRSIDRGRIEIKYVVPEGLATQVLQWSSMFLKRDRGLSLPQRVTSLYLDTPTLRFFRWHLEGSTDRFKLRVRGYGDRLDDHLYAETKRKTGSIVRKDRAEISVAALSAVLGATDAIPEQDLEVNRSEALHSFLRRRKAFNAEPKMLVSCERQSLRESAGTGEVAVTIDRHLQYQQTCRPDLIADAVAWRTISLPRLVGSETAIIELKYSHRPPQWMKTLIAKLAPHRINFSKYKAAMQQHIEWSTCHAQSCEPGIEYAGVGHRAVVRAVPDDRVGLYAY